MKLPGSRATAIRGYHHGTRTDITITVPLPVAKQLNLIPQYHPNVKMGKVPGHRWEWDIKSNNEVVLRRIR